MMKELYRMEMRKALEKAAMYRAKASDCDYPEGKETWGNMAALMDEQAFIWECASR